MQHFGRLAVLAAPLAMASIAVGQEIRNLPIDAPIVAEARPQVYGGGMDAGQFHRQQAALSAWLAGEIPARVLDNPNSVRITQDEALELANAPFTGQSPMKVGFVKPLANALQVRGIARTTARLKGADAVPFAGGTLSRNADGSLVWAASFTSPGAAGLRLHLENATLPEGAELYFYSQLGEAYGPYKSAADLWTHSVQGSTGVLQLHVPARTDLNGISFLVTEVAHVGEEFYGGLQGNTASFCSFNEPCIENVNCGSNAAVNDAKNGVAKMLWVSGAFLYTCSGGLIADTNPSVSNLFLTANHCLNRNRDAQSLEAFFSYDVSCGTSTCTATFTDPPSNLISGKTLGASVAATGSTSDYTILQLSQNPPSGSVFLGWSTTAVANSNNTSLYRVSHPSGAPQAYSAHHVDTGSVQCQGWPRGAWIYSHDDVGATEGGSSGSPVVNSAGQIVGQLTGGCGYNINDVCDSVNNWTVDGAFANYYSAVSSLLGGGGCTPSAEVCNDGNDNDCDGNTDCADSDCTGDPACGGGGCSPVGASCTVNSDCCSNSCKGPNGRKTCK